MKYLWNCSDSCVGSPRHEVCQDSVFIRPNNPKESHLVVAALSDGAGSAYKSEFGSKALVEGITEYVISSFDILLKKIEKDALEFKRKVVEEALKLLNETAENQLCTVKDLSSTLMFIASDGKKAIFFHVGDGVIILRRGMEYSVVSKPYNGEYANETVFINSRDAVETARAGIIEFSEDYSFFLMSDGPEPVFYSKKTEGVFSLKLLEFVDDSLKKMRNEEVRNNFLEYVLNERCRPYSADDLSIVVVSCRRNTSKPKRRLRRSRGVNRHKGRKKA